MSYQINNFNGTFLTTVQDGTVDTTTDLTLVGKNYAGYGAIENENFVYLLQNFANTTPPPKKLLGQIWYDSGTNKLKFYDGTQFRSSGTTETGTSAPAGLQTGDFWFDTGAKQLYAWNGSDFTLIGPQASPALGQSAVIPVVVKDTLGGNQTILKLVASGNVVGIISDTTFELDQDINPITNFSYIKRGYTLVSTQNNTGVTSDDHRFFGTATNTDRLGGFLASEYLKSGDVVFTQEVSFKNPGYTVGDDNIFRLRIENGYQIVAESRVNFNPITFRLTNGSDVRDIGIITATGIVPGDNNLYSLGQNTSIWNSVWASTVNGNLVGNVTGDVTGSVSGSLYSSDSTLLVNGTTKQIGYTGANIVGNLLGSVNGNLTGTASNASALNFYEPAQDIPGTVNKTSIPVRDSLGNLYATQFVGTADKADELLVGSDYRSTSTAADSNTVAARTETGDLYANLFQGTATTARYADLAEKYLTDKKYDPGTVVMIGGEKEVTESKSGFRAIGVVSTNPAYMMNAELKGGTYIALKGRVPCKVEGAVIKGHRLVAGDNGVAVSVDFHGTHVGGYFAIALESSEDTGVKVIEVLVL